jgi:hypothetical protein
MGSMQGSNLQEFVSKPNLQPNLKVQPKMSNNFLTVHARRKTSTDNLYKMAATESIGDIRYRLWHHLAAKTIPVSIFKAKNRPKHVNGER